MPWVELSGSTQGVRWHDPTGIDQGWPGLLVMYGGNPEEVLLLVLLVGVPAIEPWEPLRGLLVGLEAVEPWEPLRGLLVGLEAAGVEVPLVVEPAPG